jgi:hypothetical protein
MKEQKGKKKEKKEEKKKKKRKGSEDDGPRGFQRKYTNVIAVKGGRKEQQRAVRGLRGNWPNQKRRIKEI